MENLLRDYPVIIDIPVAWGEMDAFQHLNNVVYFRYFESARIAYFDAIDAMKVMETTGVGPILAETRCRYRIPLTFPDTVSEVAFLDQVRQRQAPSHIVLRNADHELEIRFYKTVLELSRSFDVCV